MRPENALNTRLVFPVDDGRWVVEESWNLDSQDCPFVVYGDLPPGQTRQDYRIHKVLTDDEFRNARVSLSVLSVGERKPR